MNSQEHRELRELLGAFALKQLDSADEVRLRAHLDGCADCRAELEAIAPLAGALRIVDLDRLAADLPRPPTALEQQIVDAISHEVGSGAVRRPRSRWLAVAATAVVVAVAGAGIGYGLAPRPPHVPLESVAVTSTAQGVESSAAVVPHTWGMEIKLTARGFARGDRFRVVVITTSGVTSSAGEFVGTGSQEMRCNLNSAVLRDQARAFRVLDANGKVVLTAAV